MLWGRFGTVRKASFIPEALTTSDCQMGAVTCEGSDSKRAPCEGSDSKRAPCEGSMKKASVDDASALTEDSTGRDSSELRCGAKKASVDDASALTEDSTG